MTKEVEKDFENNKICLFCEKEIIDKKVRDHCHLTGIYRGPAHSKCNINVEQYQRNFNIVILHKFRFYDCHLFYIKLVDKKKNTIEFKFIRRTNEEYTSILYGCVRFFDNY